MQTRSGRKIEYGEEVPPKRRQKEPSKKKQPAKKASKTETKEEVESTTHHRGEEAGEAEILEKGLIYFFYRPKVGVEEAHGPEDVQRMYILMWPGAPAIRKDEEEMKHTEGKTGVGEPERLIVVAKKKLPDVEHHKHQLFWGFVEKVSRRVEDVEEELEPVTYTTKTRGERHVEGARPIGEGVYALVKHHGHTHLAYVLELPEEPTPIQKAFNISKEGSFVLQVKNPDFGGSFLKGDKKAHYPEEVKKHFTSEKTGRTLKFANAVPELLDYEGAELLFIGASADLKAEFGETGEYIEQLEKIDAKKLTSDKLWKELHMSKAEHPPEPLLKGKWK
jgi:hypothetical protein